MKKSMMFFSAAVMLAVACTKEINENSVVKAPEITAYQETDGKTKSILSVNGEGAGTIYWKPADDIKVFYGTTGVKYTSTNTENSTTAVFETSAVIGSTEGASINNWGLYPYDADATCDGSKVTTTIPNTQYGVPETFDDDLFPTLAHSTSREFQFYNVCGGIKFSLSRADITKITFKGNNNENLAGKVDLTFVDDVPAATVVSGATMITLTPKTGDYFAQGSNYYIITLPVSMTGGFTMTFETATQIGTFNYSAKTVTVSRSTFSKKADIDTYATFIDKPSAATDLSASETANCYIVSAAGTYKFKTVQGNSSTSVGDVKGVKVLWESLGTGTAPSVGDLIQKSVSYADNYIIFSTNENYQRGNAVIAAYSDEGCSEGNVLWSWHIWLTGEDLSNNDKELRNSAGPMMDRNLGALYAEKSEYNPFSLLYQYGRKDPFLGGYRYYDYSSYSLSIKQAVSTGTWENTPLESGYSYANKHPMQFLTSWGDGSSDSTGWTDDKSINDPCPPGYKVPDQYTYTSLFETYYLSESSYRDVGNKGTTCYWYNGPGYTDYRSIWFPYAGVLLSDGSFGKLNLTGGQYDEGLMWTVNYAFYHTAHYGYIRTNYTTSLELGGAVRCVTKDSPKLIMPEELTLDKEQVTIEPYGEFDIKVSISPDESTLKKYHWGWTDHFSIESIGEDTYKFTDKRGTIGKTFVGAYSPLAVYAANDEYKTDWSSPVAKKCTVNVCPKEPDIHGYPPYGYGGWYISAKAGDTFSCHLRIGTCDDGPNYYKIYLDETEIGSNKYYGLSSYDTDFSYTFTEAFTGWLFIEVGWGFCVSDIETTASVLGRGNTWGTDVDLCMSDSWKNGTPNYKFMYENHVVTFN